MEDLFSIHKKIMLVKKLLRNSEVSYNELLVLIAISRNISSLLQISIFLNKDKSTIFKNIKMLEEKKYIKLIGKKGQVKNYFFSKEGVFLFDKLSSEINSYLR